MATYEVTVPGTAGMELVTIEAKSFAVDPRGELVFSNGADATAVFAAGRWNHVIKKQPDTFGDATKAVSI
jgi:hypothetical protein